MSLASLGYREPRVVALIVLVIVSAGASALLSLGRQEDPELTGLYATATTIYPGAPPTRVESLVSDPIETELAEIGDVALVESASADEISIVNIELASTLGADELDAVWNEVRDALEDAERAFPSGARSPELSIESATAWTSIVAMVPSPGVSLELAARHADALADRLRRITGTSKVELFGEPDEEVAVEVDPVRLASLGLSIDAVAAAIGEADAKFRAGRLRGEGNDWLIALQGDITTLERVRAIPLHGAMAPSSDAGDGRAQASVVRLGDIAEVSRVGREPALELARVGERNAVIVAARLSPGLQVDVWSADVRGVIAQVADDLPDGIALETLFEQSGYTRDRLLGVGANLGIGVALVIAVLFVTLGARSALLVAAVLPLVTLATLATMNLIRLPIHQMSLTGLVVALGLLVDAAIVMTDEIRQRLARGLDRATAVEASVRRLFGPLAASTVTTALSFLPMALLPGGAGDFVGAIAIAVIVMLLWSFVIAMTVTPALAGRWLPAASAGDARTPGRVARTGARLIAWSLERPVASIAWALVLPVMGFLAAPTLTAQFFPGVDRDQLTIELETAPGTALETTAALAAAVQATLATEDEIAGIAWTIGSSAPPFYYNLVPNRERAPDYAQALVTTVSAAATDRLVPRLQNELSERFPDARVLVQGLVQGPPIAAPVELRIVGRELSVLRERGDALRRIVGAVDGVAVVRSTLAAAAPRIELDVNEADAATLGLSLGAIARQLDAALEGRAGGSLVDGDESLAVRVRADAGRRDDLAWLAHLPLTTPAGRAVPLSAVATLEVVPSDATIVRRDGERVNSIQAFPRHGLLPEEVLGAVQAALAAEGFELPSGYRLQLGGDSDARDDTVNDLLASLGLIVTLSIASVVLALGSFRLAGVTLMVALLSAGLSMLSLALLQHPFGIQALIGVIGSIGVSINASIVILTALRADTRASAGDRAAMAEVVARSGRHIISTTLTTFGGFLPLILAGGGFWPPFATAIAGGVLLSTVVSFGFVPPMFRLLGVRPAVAADARDAPAPATA